MSPWQYTSGWMALLAALGLCVIVLHSKINEGVLIKAGLIGLIFSLLVTFALTISQNLYLEYYWRSTLVTKASLCLICVGIFVRAHWYAKRTCQGDVCQSRRRRWFERLGAVLSRPADDVAKLFNADSAPAPLDELKRRD